MYYTEQVIDDILHYKSHPDGEWKRVSATKLTRRLMEAEAEINRLKVNLSVAGKPTN